MKTQLKLITYHDKILFKKLSVYQNLEHMATRLT